MGGACRVHAETKELASSDRKVTAVEFEPTPLRSGALSHRLRPLGQTVLEEPMKKDDVRVSLVRALVATMAETRHTPSAIATETAVWCQQSCGTQHMPAITAS